MLFIQIQRFGNALKQIAQLIKMDVGLKLHLQNQADGIHILTRELNWEFLHAMQLILAEALQLSGMIWDQLPG